MSSAEWLHIATLALGPHPTRMGTPNVIGGTSHTVALCSAAEAGNGHFEHLVMELEGQLETISHGSWQGSWLSMEAACALACLVTACALRPGVEVKRALTLVQRGMTFTQQGLDAEGVDHQVDSWSPTPNSQIWMCWTWSRVVTCISERQVPGPWGASQCPSAIFVVEADSCLLHL